MWTLLALIAAAGSGTRGHAGDGALPPTLDARLRAALVSPFAAERQSLPARGIPRDGADPTSERSTSSTDRWIGCFVEGPVDAEALRSAGARVGTRVAGRWTVRVPLTRLTRLAGLAGVHRIRAASRTEPQLDLAALDTRAHLVQGGLPDTAHGPCGDGVLLGVVDTGLALQHDDFRNAQGFTRVAALWDQTDAAGPAPAGFGYGSEWTGAQVDLGLCRERDSTYYGHGTHVAGAAAGSGRATGNGRPPFTYVGVAPRARLGIVSTTWDDISIVDGVAWLFAKAGELGIPCVVNLSLGTSYGPHDGTADLDLAMNALSGPGRIIVASAGNSNGRGSHGEGIAPASGTGTVAVRIFGYTPSATAADGLSIDGWYEGGDNIGIAVRTPGGTVVGPVAKGASLGQATPEGWISIDQTGVEATNANGDVEVLIEISDGAGTAPAAGEYEIRLTRMSAPAGGQVDFWIYDATFAYPPAFSTGREEQEIVISPATADSVIAVAAHTTRVSWTALNSGTYNYGQTLNQIGNFSSVGPRRDNTLKPDLSAPGTAIASAHSPQSQPNPAANILPDGVHKILQGTSMSSPQVAGAVAMMLSHWPALSTRQARDALRASARADAFTGAVPNVTWGYGKLDLENLFRQRLAFTTEIDPPGIALPGSRAWLHALCLTPASAAWSLDAVARVSDSRGWLARVDGLSSFPVATWSDTVESILPGQRACVPRSGHLVLDIPPATPSGDSTVVTLAVEPRGMPFLEQTRTTTIRVSALAASAGGAPPQGLVARVIHATPRGLELEIESGGNTAAVRFELADVGGRRIGAATEFPAGPGPRRVRWSPVSVPLARGLYFLRVVQGSESRVVRVVIL